MEIRLLTSQEDKQRTISLYRQAFSDPEEYIDYYYKERCRDNRIMAACEGERVLSMIQLNPYRMLIDGREWQLHYLVAGATEKAVRHKGYYRAVIESAVSLLAGEGEPFCYLMPSSEELYQKLGFSVICEFDKNRERSKQELEQYFDIYCVRDEAYEKRMKAEKELEAVLKELEEKKAADASAISEALAEERTGFPENPVIMAHIADKESFARMSGVPPQADDMERFAWLQQKRICISEDT